MDFQELISYALPVVYSLVGLALIWLLVEVIMFLRKTSKTVDEMKAQLEPTLAHVDNITASLEPAMTKIDPMCDRLILTIDAANLEVMRLDQILENVTDITASVSSATAAVDAVTSAPVDLINAVTGRVSKAIKGGAASEETVRLGAAKANKESAVSRLDTSAMVDIASDAGNSLKQKAGSLLRDTKETFSEVKTSLKSGISKATGETHCAADAEEKLSEELDDAQEQLFETISGTAAQEPAGLDAKEPASGSSQPVCGAHSQESQNDPSQDLPSDRGGYYTYPSND